MNKAMDLAWRFLFFAFCSFVFAPLSIAVSVIFFSIFYNSDVNPILVIFIGFYFIIYYIFELKIISIIVHLFGILSIFLLPISCTFIKTRHFGIIVFPILGLISNLIGMKIFSFAEKSEIILFIQATQGIIHGLIFSFLAKEPRSSRHKYLRSEARL